MEAQFQADLNWIQSEVSKIKDPKFLERVKNLLKERPSSNSSEDWVKKRMVEAALASEEDIKAGKVYTIEEARKMLEERRKLWK